MGACGVVVREVRAQQATEVSFVEHEEVIETFAPDRPDHTLHKGILPGGSWGYEDLANPQAFGASGEHLAVDRIAIPEEILRGRRILERLDDLLGGPGGGGVIGDIDVDECPAVVAEHDEREEQAEGEGGDDDEVDRDDVLEMGVKEGPPRR